MNPFINQIASKDTIELLAKFFEAAGKAVRDSDYDPQVVEAFDLIQAVSCFRYFPTADQCIAAFPSLEQDRHKVEYIWEQFGKLDTKQLCDVYISSLHKLELTDELVT